MTSQPGAPAAPPAEDRSSLPPDPERYDEYRNVAARKRGLPKPYIAGGEDPDLPEPRSRPSARTSGSSSR